MGVSPILRSKSRFRGPILALLFAPGLATLLSAAEPTPEQLEFFEKKIRPVLADRCFKCHSRESEKLKGGLRLDTLAAALEGGDTGPAIEPGDLEKSLLIEAVRYENVDLEMPPKAKLGDAVIADLEKWVAMGAPWPAGEGADAGPVAEEFDIEKRRAGHWCWQPVRAVKPPSVNGAGWPDSPIDHFILARLEKEDLKPAAPADRRVLIRRATFDLTGLPPTPAEVAAFLADKSPDAFAHLVDRLLESPRFGERWGRHWLDLVRYAETLGHEFDYPIDNAYRFRDYVIRAFNADLPYDQLIREHVAGDLLPEPRHHPEERFNESIIGSGFWFFHEATHAPTDVRGNEADHIDNRIDVFSKTFLGLTVSCARCHDHKFDAIATSDYYALAGYLQSSRRQDAMLDPARRIATARDRLATTRRDAAPMLASAFEKRDAAKTFAKYLLATDEAIVESRSGGPGIPPAGVIARVAERRSLDAGLLTRWLRALAPETAGTGDPLYAWVRGKSPDWKKFRERSAKADSEMASIRGDGLVFENFDAGSLDGWFLTGHAFDEDPTKTATLSNGTPHPVAKPGVMHSGLYGDRLCGVLRSPTFEITHPFLHVRMKAKDVSVRLVIDGYQLNRRHGLLFGGTIIKEKDSDTGGRFAWKTMDGYKGAYIGHRAWLEFVDEGDGYVALDEIVFSNDHLPPIHCGPVTQRVFAMTGDERPDLEALAAVFGEIWAESVAGLGGKDFDDAHESLVNWVAEHGLLPCNPALADARARAAEIDETIPAPLFAVAHADGTPENDFIHIRGSHKSLGAEVPRRFLLALGGEDRGPPGDASGRLELAAQITDPANPLPARVMVNRIWHHLFGRGIVPSVDDFGVMGRPPSHPALLDWLAADFVNHGWSIKDAIRRIMLSKTYRMSSTAAKDLGPGVIAGRDPENVLLHRMPVRRLQAEAIRDAILAVSGGLDETMFGPSVPVHLTGFMEGRGRPKDKGPLDGAGRRSIYLEIRRNFLNPMMLAFDMPSPFSTMGRRSVSNVPAQSLVLMNDPFVVDQAALWAKRIVEEESGVAERISAMFEAAFSRPPTEDELAAATEFLRAQADLRFAGGLEDHRLWADLAHVLFNKKEFIYVN